MAAISFVLKRREASSSSCRVNCFDDMIPVDDVLDLNGAHDGNCRFRILYC